MKIAILGWGSLIWDPRDLPREGPWLQGGPALPIEFSRISSDGRLTLAIDNVSGTRVPTRYVQSPRTDIDDALGDLCRREGTKKARIGYVDRPHEGHHSRLDCVTSAVREWAEVSAFDAVVWTDLPPNFAEELDTDFSVDAAVRYLKTLPKSVMEKAKKYIQNAPPEVDTVLRRKLRELNCIE